MYDHLFWELHQHGRISGAQADAAGARSKAGQVAHEIEVLQAQVDRLTLACQSLWELLRDDGVFDEERLLDKIQEVDLRDGRADGKIGPRAIDCPACRRRSKSGRRQCMYCGTPLTDDSNHVFE